MTNISPSPTPDHPHVADETIRAWASILALWRLCVKPACRRTRACRGDVRKCFPRHFALLPGGVQVWFAMLGNAPEGVSPDEAVSTLDETQMGQAFRAWHENVAASLGEAASLPQAWWEQAENP